MPLCLSSIAIFFENFGYRLCPSLSRFFRSNPLQQPILADSLLQFLQPPPPPFLRPTTLDSTRLDSTRSQGFLGHSRETLTRASVRATAGRVLVGLHALANARPCGRTRRIESGGRNRSAGSSVYYIHRASLPEPSPRGLGTQ